MRAHTPLSQFYTPTYTLPDQQTAHTCSYTLPDQQIPALIFLCEMMDTAAGRGVVVQMLREGV
jgi:hypothetical protein